jgi:hypothetical protein
MVLSSANVVGVSQKIAYLGMILPSRFVNTEINELERRIRARLCARSGRGHFRTWSEWSTD